MNSRSRKTYIEILPAALLSQRSTWQKMTRMLPIGSCLLVINRNDSRQTKLMQTLARSFREKGRQVVIWNVR